MGPSASLPHPYLTRPIDGHRAFFLGLPHLPGYFTITISCPNQDKLAHMGELDVLQAHIAKAANREDVKVSDIRIATEWR